MSYLVKFIAVFLIVTECGVLDSVGLLAAEKTTTYALGVKLKKSTGRHRWWKGVYVL